jgi:y4mF family transcriptional regulator
MNNKIKLLRVAIGEQIRLRRKELMITQPNLADIAGVSVNTLYKIERGQANPTIEVLGKILDVLGLEITVGVKQLKL